MAGIGPGVAKQGALRRRLSVDSVSHGQKFEVVETGRCPGGIGL
jgi:hypothetical protein